MFLDGSEDVHESDFCGEGVAVVDEGGAVGAVPAVELYTAAASAEAPYIGFERRLARQLVSSQIPKGV